MSDLVLESEIRVPTPFDVYSEVVADVLPGLQSLLKHIDPKYFYDRRGSHLFQLLCRTEDYYLTRAENEILETYVEEIVALSGKHCILIEPGAGGCEKVEHLLPALRPARYIPIDCSDVLLRESAQRLSIEYPWLQCFPVTANFSDLPLLQRMLPPTRKLVFFPGSTVGNFAPADAVRFLEVLRGIAGSDGGVLIGVDLDKDEATLNRAYNDRAGITEKFNLNALRHLNRVAGADFKISQFSHVAKYDRDRKCIDMFLRSDCEQSVLIGGYTIRFAAGELLHTESSYKYSVEDFSRLASKAGLIRARTWHDGEKKFAMHYFIAANESDTRH